MDLGELFLYLSAQTDLTVSCTGALRSVDAGSGSDFLVFDKGVCLDFVKFERENEPLFLDSFL